MSRNQWRLRTRMCACIYLHVRSADARCTHTHKNILCATIRSRPFLDPDVVSSVIDCCLHHCTPIASAASHAAAMHQKNVPMYEIRSGICEINNRTLHVLSRAPTLHRNSFHNLLRSNRIVKERSSQFGQNISWRDCIDVHLEACPFVSESFGDLRNSAVACCICGDVQAASETLHGSNVDDLSALLVEHFASDPLAHAKDRRQIEVDYTVPVPFSKVHGRCAHCHSCTVHKNVNMAPMLKNRVNGLIAQSIIP